MGCGVICRRAVVGQLVGERLCNMGRWCMLQSRPRKTTPLHQWRRRWTPFRYVSWPRTAPCVVSLWAVRCSDCSNGHLRIGLPEPRSQATRAIKSASRRLRSHGSPVYGQLGVGRCHTTAALTRVDVQQQEPQEERRRNGGERWPFENFSQLFRLISQRQD